MIVNLKGGALSFFDENYPSRLLALVFMEEAGAILTVRFSWKLLGYKLSVDEARYYYYTDTSTSTFMH